MSYRIRKNLNNQIFFLLMAKLRLPVKNGIHVLKKLADQITTNQLLNFLGVCKAKMLGKSTKCLTLLGKFIHSGSNSIFFLRRVCWYIHKNCFRSVRNVFCNLKTVAYKIAFTISLWFMFNIGQNAR